MIVKYVIDHISIFGSEQTTFHRKDTLVVFLNRLGCAEKK